MVNYHCSIKYKNNKVYKASRIFFITCIKIGRCKFDNVCKASGVDSPAYIKIRCIKFNNVCKACRIVSYVKIRLEELLHHLH